MNKILPYLIPLFFLVSCKHDKKHETATKGPDSPLFSLITPAVSGITFTNNLTETDEINPITYQYIYNGSGVAVGDINNDGLQDIFFAANQESCKLFLYKGNFKFDDITAKASLTTKNWCTGVTMADVNADGYLDIYVSCGGKFTTPEERANLLFINNKNLTFTERAAAYGIDDKGFSGHDIFRFRPGWRP